MDESNESAEIMHRTDKNAKEVAMAMREVVRNFIKDYSIVEISIGLGVTICNLILISNADYDEKKIWFNWLQENDKMNFNNLLEKFKQ